jgi:glycosyltransferase involved in cell wall biosynthesis
LIVGGGELRVPAGVEATNLGWRDDLRGIYERATVLIRLTPHDGLSLMVLEALSFGRYVMWSKPFPYAFHIRSQSDLRAGLRSLIERHRRGELLAQYTAAEKISREYTTERAVDQILRSWESVR